MIDLTDIIVDGQTVGYTWNKETGNRVLVVVDDSIDVLVQATPNNGHQYGIKPIGLSFPNSNESRGLGFFTLPKPNDKRQTAIIAEAIRKWLTPFLAEGCRCQLLVDFYYGEGFDNTQDSGTYFVKHWQSLSIQSEIAYISLGGLDSVSQDNSDPLKSFRKSEIEEYYTQYGNLPPKLKKWLGIEEHPLDSLWNDSKEWFSRKPDFGSINFSPLIHDFPRDWKYSDLGVKDKINTSYRRTVQDALGIARTPDNWWKSVESIEKIHESLKRLCGQCFCGQTDNPGNSSYHISTGAAYLLVLMAYYRVHGNVSAVTSSILNWENYPLIKSPVFPLQSRRIARSSCKALYDVLFELFSSTDSDVESTFFEDEGRILKIQFSHDIGTELSKVMTEKMHGFIHDRGSDSSESQNQVLDPPAAGHVRSALVNLMGHLAISQVGFMAPGVIYLKGNTLIIASSESL